MTVRNKILGLKRGGTCAARVTNVGLVTDRRQDIWIKTESGEEVRLAVGGVSVPLRPGHKMRAFFASKDTSMLPVLVAVKNLSTGETFETINAQNRLPSPGFFKVSLLSTFGAGVVTGAVMLGGIVGGCVLMGNGQ